MKRTAKFVTASLGLIVFTSMFLAASPGQAQSLTQERFRELHQELQPSADDPWRTIPWKTSLLEAQQQACKTKQPIFIWAMDGHPLGCT